MIDTELNVKKRPLLYSQKKLESWIPGTKTLFSAVHLLVVLLQITMPHFQATGRAAHRMIISAVIQGLSPTPNFPT